MLSSPEWADTIPLTVAVQPTVECLPALYAVEAGMLDTLGFEVQVTTVAAMMDIDTALVRGHVTLGVTALTRIDVMQRKGWNAPVPVAELPERLYLLTARQKRIRTLPQLKDRMLAVERYANADYWSDWLAAEAGLEKADIFRPQVNDLRLRADMLLGQLVDAALLPEPYATEARLTNCRMVWQTPDTVPGFLCLAAWAGADSLTMAKAARFVDVWNEAAREMCQAPDTLALTRAMRLLPVSQQALDSMPQPQPQPLQAPRHMPEAREWVEARIREAS